MVISGVFKYRLINTNTAAQMMATPQAGMQYPGITTAFIFVQSNYHRVFPAFCLAKEISFLTHLVEATLYYHHLSV